jgi:hypothetical protein
VTGYQIFQETENLNRDEQERTAGFGGGGKEPAGAFAEEYRLSSVDKEMMAGIDVIGYRVFSQ